MAQNYYDEFVKLPLDKMAQNGGYDVPIQRNTCSKNIIKKNCR